MKKVILGVFAAVLLAGATAYASSSLKKADCCAPGKSCCYPGSSCCKK